MHLWTCGCEQPSKNIFLQQSAYYLKVVSRKFLLLLFFQVYKKAFPKLRKIVVIALQRLFLFWRKLKFRTLDIQISWCHQMLKHKKRNRFYWISLELNTACKWNLASLYHITKEKSLSKVYSKSETWKLVPFCGLKEVSTTSIGKLNF